MPISNTFTRQEISKLFSSARRCLKHPSLDILLAPSLTGSSGRILVVTPRRVGNAVKRNTVRRRLKALYHEGGFTARGYDCVVIVKYDGVSKSFDELRALLLQAFASPYLPKISYERE